MGRRGNAYDNAVAESFFATLETELLDRNTYHTRNQARTAVFDFIEGFYNPTRRHSTLGYQSPTNYERNPPTTPLNPQTENRPQKRGNSSEGLMCGEVAGSGGYSHMLVSSSCRVVSRWNKRLMLM